MRSHALSRITSSVCGFEIEFANERTCTERVELIMNQLAQREGVTESLKAADQMEWVRRMNNIRASAEEIVLSELVYN